MKRSATSKAQKCNALVLTATLALCAMAPCVFASYTPIKSCESGTVTGTNCSQYAQDMKSKFVKNDSDCKSDELNGTDCYSLCSGSVGKCQPTSHTWLTLVKNTWKPTIKACCKANIETKIENIINQF